MRSCEDRTTTGMFACADCGGEVLEAVTDGATTNFRCVICGACWHDELGFVSRVPPGSCPGCEHREECLRLAQAGRP